MTDTLGSLLENGGFDVVQLEGVHMAGYLPLFTASASPPVLSCDWHNVESDLLERYRQAAPSPVHSLYAAATAAKLRTTERDLLRTCGLHLTCSERDRQLLRGFEATARIEVVENGVDTTYFTADESGGGDTPRDFVFVGSMDYWANAKAAIWFTEAIWPAIRRHFPEAQFLIVGRSPGERVRGLERHPGVVVTGTVEDIRPYYRRALAAVVPLQSGGGTRLKILEAMAAGVPVVSTGIGAEGLAVEPGSHYLRADSPEAFVESVRRIALDRGARERITRAAGELVRARYEWKVIGETLAECYSPAYGSRQHEKR